MNKRIESSQKNAADFQQFQTIIQHRIVQSRTRSETAYRFLIKRRTSRLRTPSLTLDRFPFPRKTMERTVENPSSK